MTKLVQIECGHANPKLTSLFVSAIIVIVDKGTGDGTFLRRHHKRGVYTCDVYNIYVYGIYYAYCII